MSQDTNGPDFETLKNLRERIPDMAYAMVNRRIGGKGRPVAKPYPTRSCQVCGKNFAFVTRTEVPDLKDIKLDESCPECSEKLKKGQVALIVPGLRFCFITPSPKSKLAENAGQVITVLPGTLNAVEKFFKLEWQVREQDKKA